MISVELINILIFLLPGFLAATIFYWLTAHTKPSTFGQVVQALIFTFVVHILFSILFKEQIKLLEESSLELNRNLIWLILIAVCLGLLFAWISNKDLMRKFFRYIRTENNKGKLLPVGMVFSFFAPPQLLRCVVHGGKPPPLRLAYRVAQ